MPLEGCSTVRKYKSAENKFIVQQCRKVSFFGIVEHFLIFGIVERARTFVLPLQH